MAKTTFAHHNTYSQKGNSKSRSVRDICAEAGREQGAAPHVEMPTKPEILQGINPSEIPDLIESRVNGQNKTLREMRKAETTKEKGIRKDTHVLSAAVFSYPDPVGQTDKEDYQRWREDVVSFANKDCQRLGLEVLSIVEHTDEAHPHIHVLSVPRIEPLSRMQKANPRMDAKRCHDGHKAQAAHIEQGLHGSPSRSYKAAMCNWQDRYHEQVGAKHGQARLGPKRARMDRARWMAEKKRLAKMKGFHKDHHRAVQNKRVEVLHLSEIGRQKELEHEKALAEREQAFNEQTKELQQSIAHLKDAQKTEKQALEAAETRKRQVEQKASEATRKATDAEMREKRANKRVEQLKALGWRLRALWDSLRESGLRRKLQAEVEEKVSTSEKIAAERLVLAEQRKAELDQVQQQAEKEKTTREVQFKNEKTKLVRQANNIIADQNGYIEKLEAVLSPSQKQTLEREKSQTNKRGLSR